MYLTVRKVFPLFSFILLLLVTSLWITLNISSSFLLFILFMFLENSDGGAVLERMGFYFPATWGNQKLSFNKWELLTYCLTDSSCWFPRGWKWKLTCKRQWRFANVAWYWANCLSLLCSPVVPLGAWGWGGGCLMGATQDWVRCPWVITATNLQCSLGQISYCFSLLPSL